MTSKQGPAPDSSGDGSSSRSEPAPEPLVLYDAEPPERAWTEIFALLFTVTAAALVLVGFAGVLPRGLDATLLAGSVMLFCAGPCVIAMTAMSRALIGVRIEGDQLVIKERLLGFCRRKSSWPLDRVHSVSLRDEFIGRFHRRARAVLSVNGRGFKIYHASAAQCGDLDGRLIAAISEARGAPLETSWLDRLPRLARLALMVALGLFGLVVGVAALALTSSMLNPR